MFGQPTNHTMYNTVFYVVYYSILWIIYYLILINRLDQTHQTIFTEQCTILCSVYNMYYNLLHHIQRILLWGKMFTTIGAGWHFRNVKLVGHTGRHNLPTLGVGRGKRSKNGFDAFVFFDFTFNIGMWAISWLHIKVLDIGNTFTAYTSDTIFIK